MNKTNSFFLCSLKNGFHSGGKRKRKRNFLPTVKRGNCLIFSYRNATIHRMESYIKGLDEFFASQYSDYTKISALSGYKMPNMLHVGKDGNLSRKDSAYMRICYQENSGEVLAALKETLADTDFSFSFSFRPIRDRFRDISRKYTFAKILPEALRHVGETVETAGEKLDIEPRFWKLIVRGKLYPEKNTVLALSLVCRLQQQDFENLLAVCGYSLDDTSVRDVVVKFLMQQKIFNEEMRDACLNEYKITNLPIKRV